MNLNRKFLGITVCEKVSAYADLLAVICCFFAFVWSGKKPEVAANTRSTSFAKGWWWCTKKNEIRRENLRDIDGWGMTGVSAVGRLCRWQREKNPATYSVSYFIYYLLALLGCDRMSLGECLFEKFDFEFLADCV